MTDLALEDIDITGIKEHPATDSVRLHGPPGTGKTTESAARVALLLRDCGYSIDQVGWATYRRMLANDTLRRLAKWGVINWGELEDPTKGATRNIGTIHAIAKRSAGGLQDPVEQYHKVAFCKKHNIRWKSQDPWERTPGKQLFDAFGWLKNNLQDPRNDNAIYHYPNRDDLPKTWRTGVSSIWQSWENYKEYHGVIDFHEMLEAALEQPAIPTRDVLVVDEYHDATALMARVCEMWMDAADTVIVAGDPHQVVNQYDGADPRFFERLPYPKILLGKSHRVGPQIWEPAHRILSRAHKPPDIEPSDTPTSITRYLSPQFSKTEGGGWNTPLRDKPASPTWMIDEFGSDMLFLTRTRRQADTIGVTLEKAGIIYHSQSQLNGWNSDRAEERLGLFNGLQKIKGHKPSDFDSADKFVHGLDHFEKGTRDPERTRLEPNEASALLKYTPARRCLTQSREETKEVCDKIRNDNVPVTLADYDAYVEKEFWTTFTRGADSEEWLLKGPRNERARTTLQTALRNNNGPIDPNAIDIGVMTIHASKGSEAANVVIYDGVTKRISQAIEASQEAWKNEARTWYVALTRASERVHVMCDGFHWTSPYLPTDIDRTPQQIVEVPPQEGIKDGL